MKKSRRKYPGLIEYLESRLGPSVVSGRGWNDWLSLSSMDRYSGRMAQVQRSDERKWRVIEDFPNYKVSTGGVVLRITRASGTYPGKRVKEVEINQYKAVRMMRSGKIVKRYVHVLVARAFIGPPPSDRHEVNHKDCDPHNNRVSNLEYLTRRENIQHAIRMGVKYSFPTGDAHPFCRITDDAVSRLRTLAEEGVPTCELSDEFGITTGHVRKIVRGMIR